MAKRSRKLSPEQKAQAEADRLAAQAEFDGAGEQGEVQVKEADPAELVQHLEEAPEPEAMTKEEADAVPEVADGEKANNSVVAAKFKDKYLANARLNGIPGKAAKRSNWDWLSQQIAGYCLDDKHKIDINKFLSVLDANGVDHSKWTNRNKGWEGRLRMTGRVALQKVVANKEQLVLGENVAIPPAEFVARFKTKE